MTLSSCYFCGTAIEEPLSEYPVVPDAFAPSPDEQGTVVLCPSCHRKLSRVMDHVVDAVDDRQRRFDPADASSESDSAAATDDAGTESATRSTDSADAAAGIEVDDPPTIDEDAADDLLETGPSSESGGAGDADPGETDAAEETPDEPRADDGITVDDGTGTTAERAGDGADAAASGSGTEGNAGGATASAGGSPSDDSGGSGGGNGGDGPPQATYNRVVRLLQNREFPVERAEIATVATNAYEIPPEDFDAVIETAVDRGVLVEEGQYLKQPE